MLPLRPHPRDTVRRKDTEGIGARPRLRQRSSCPARTFGKEPTEKAVRMHAAFATANKDKMARSGESARWRASASSSTAHRRHGETPRDGPGGDVQQALSIVGSAGAGQSV